KGSTRARGSGVGDQLRRAPHAVVAPAGARLVFPSPGWGAPPGAGGAQLRALATRAPGPGRSVARAGARGAGFLICETAGPAARVARAVIRATYRPPGGRSHTCRGGRDVPRDTERSTRASQPGNGPG